MPSSRFRTLAAYGFGRRNAFLPPIELHQQQLTQDIYRQLNDVAATLPIPPKVGYILSLIAMVIGYIVLGNMATNEVHLATSDTTYYYPSGGLSWLKRYLPLLFVVSLIETLAFINDLVMHRVLASRLRQKCATLNQTYSELQLHVKYGFSFQSVVIYMTILRLFLSPLKVSVNWRPTQIPIYIQNFPMQPPAYMQSGPNPPPGYLPSEGKPKSTV